MAHTATRRVVITGVTKGLGRALADQFRERGLVVWGCGRTREEIAALTQAFGDGHDFAVVDVAREDQVKTWAERLLTAYGPPDLLINNAAVINRNAPLWQVPAAEFDRVIDVNIKGVANVIRHIVPAMIERQTGVIVNLSSGWGRSTAPQVAPYCATKWAIEGLTRALAQELPAGMAAVPLDPGIIDTDMLRSCFGDAAANHANPRQWAQRAAPFLLELGAKDNGKPLRVPQ